MKNPTEYDDVDRRDVPIRFSAVEWSAICRAAAQQGVKPIRFIRDCVAERARFEVPQ